MAFSIALLGAAHPHVADYVRALEVTRDARITHVYDDDSARADAAARMAGASAVASREAVIEARPEGIILAGETADRARDLDAALSAGVPLLIEKPLAPTLTESIQLGRRLAEAEVPCFGAFFLRQCAALAAAREAITDQTIGRLRHVAVRHVHDGARRGWIRETWLNEPRRAGRGGFTDMGIHLVDLLTWLAGPLIRLRGEMIHTPGETVEIGGQGVAALDNGAVAGLEAGWHGETLDFSLRIVGSEGLIESEGRHLVLRRDHGAGDTLGPLEPWAGEAVRPLLETVRIGADATGLSADPMAAIDLVTAQRTLEAAYDPA